MGKRKGKKSDSEATREALECAVESGLFKSWDHSWKSFLNNPAFREWWDRHSKERRPVYVLDPDITESLAASSGKRMPLISKSNFEIEIAFEKCCRYFSADTVGVWQDKPIKYGLLGPVNAVSDELLDSIRWGKMTLDQKKSLLASLDSEAEVVNRNRRRWAGELLCNDAFMSACDELRKQWEKLNARIEFPLKRHGVGVHLSEPEQSAGKLPKKMTEFLRNAQTILDRFELAELTTFDLPLPFGPMEQMPAKVLGNLMGDVVISPVYPQNYAISREDSSSAVGRLSLSGAKSFKNETRPALHLYSPSLYERFFEMSFIELAFCSRYGSPRGYVDHLITALAAKFSISTDQIRQIRKNSAQASAHRMI